MKIKQLVFLAALTLSAITFNVSSAFSQLDSASVSLSMSSEVDFLDSTHMVDVLNIEVEVNDANSLGEIVLRVYHLDSEFPFALIKKSKQELDNEGLLVGNTMNFQLTDFESAQSYRVEASVRNLQGAQLPSIMSEIIN